MNLIIFAICCSSDWLSRTVHSVLDCHGLLLWSIVILFQFTQSSALQSRQGMICAKAVSTCRKSFKQRQQRRTGLTLSSASCCLNSSSSSESQSGNWYILMPYCSISSRICRQRKNKVSIQIWITLPFWTLALISREWTVVCLPWFSFSSPRWGWVCPLLQGRARCSPSHAELSWTPHPKAEAWKRDETQRETHYRQRNSSQFQLNQQLK